MTRMIRWLPIFVLLAGFTLSCISIETQEKRLTPRRPASEIRIDEIEKLVETNPVEAIDRIGVYREAYQQTGEEKNTEILDTLASKALEDLRQKQQQAVTEERWDDVASFSRSLASMGVVVENTGMGADFLLSGAKKKLANGNVLGAYLSAVEAHEKHPLSYDDAVFFLEHAVNAKQRRAAAYFYAAADSARSPNKQALAQFREYAQGRDAVSDMVKGVATVLVDRGFRIEKGRGLPDRVSGSAFFVDAAGYLITNYHVISSEVDPKHKGPSRMYIRMGDGSSPRYPARVIGWDKAMDLALIKTEYKPEFVFSVVDRVIPQVGDTVLAIGTPLGLLEKTVTSGIVSAVGRRILQIGDVMQIDAAVNHGNSGGPVVDTSGRLVGIVFAGIDYYQGLNFAIPAERLAAALPAMISGGKAERPWIGVTVNETPAGAEIIYAAPNTPAAEHRIAEGSIIKTINGQEIKAPEGMLIPALQDILYQLPPGELVSVETIVSASSTERKKYTLMIAPRPELPLAEAAKLDTKERIVAPLFGMVLSPFAGQSYSSSYLVKKVVRGSIADEAGISDQDPVAIRGFRLMEDDGYAIMDINVKKRRMGYLETSMQLPAWLDSPDTL